MKFLPDLQPEALPASPAAAALARPTKKTASHTPTMLLGAHHSKQRCCRLLMAATGHPTQATCSANRCICPSAHLEYLLAASEVQPKACATQRISCDVRKTAWMIHAAAQARLCTVMQCVLLAMALTATGRCA